MRHSPAVKMLVRQHYVKGASLKDVAKRTGISLSTIEKWSRKEQWRANYTSPDESIEIALARRINALADLDKTPEQLEEFVKLVEVYGKLQKDLKVSAKISAETEAIHLNKRVYAQAMGNVGWPDDVPGKPHKTYNKDPNNKTSREKKVKNDVSSITPDKLDAVREALFFAYQQLWYQHRNDRTRLILKSRQIGATYYFAFEAFDRAVRDGENCIFLSASRDQAEVFKAYIIAFAMQHFEVELKGTGVIILSNGAELRFLSTNSTTAQSYHGHLYIDELFWIPQYKKLNKVASGMASHKKWRITKFSTPSAISHDAYAEWSGELHNAKLPDNQKIEFDISHAALKHGAYGPDKKWRHMVTVEDAQEQGCDLFDIDELKTEYSEDDFANLFLCKFIDDSQSVFKLSKLLDCTVEVDDWPDYHAQQAKPFGNKPVALGYDPSRTRDNASLSVLSIPLLPKDAWRVLRTDSYHGQNIQYQNNRIKEVRDAHNVQHIGIDTTGIGHGVFDLVEAWFPLATPIHYSLDMKTTLVVKALDVIENGRFKYRAGDHEITRAFLMITKTTTGSGLITYASSRNTEAGHADIAWSVMHALNYEPIDNQARKASATFSD